MKLIRTLAVYLYLAWIVVLGVPYFKHLEKEKRSWAGSRRLCKKFMLMPAVWLVGLLR